RQEYPAAFNVNCDRRPHIRAAVDAPAFGFPSSNCRVTGFRNRVEAPHESAAARIECTHAARGLDAPNHIRDGGADDDAIAGNRRRRSDVVLPRIDEPFDALREIDLPARAKVGAWPACSHVKRDQSCIKCGEEYASGAWAIGLRDVAPEGDPAAHHLVRIAPIEIDLWI